MDVARPRFFLVYWHVSARSPLLTAIVALALLWLGRMALFLGWPADRTIDRPSFFGLFVLDILILSITAFLAIRFVRPHPGTLWFWLVSLSVCVAAVGTANHWVSALSDRAKRPAEPALARPVLDMRDGVAYWNGPIDFDSFEALKNTLEMHPQLKALSLESGGGRIAAARGMARLVSEAKLDTAVSGTCASACTIVFIAGEKRTMAEGGQLGFHGYKLLSGIQTVDAKAEQLRDRDMFSRRGVSTLFLDSAFSVPFEEIWFPDRATLYGAGVTTE